MRYVRRFFNAKHSSSGGPASVSDQEKKVTGNLSPIASADFGLVDWNDDEPSPHKWWDGRGILNSTNKYNEDQKVKWHETPFEERLEKALREETFMSQRRQRVRRPIDFNV